MWGVTKQVNNKKSLENHLGQNILHSLIWALRCSTSGHIYNNLWNTIPIDLEYNVSNTVDGTSSNSNRC